MIRLLLAMVAASIAACATDPRLDPALQEDRYVIVQVCFPKKEFITRRYVGMQEVTVWGAGTSGEDETTRTIANEPVYMKYLAHPKAFKWLLIRAHASDEHIFGPTPDSRFPKDHWTSWIPPVAVANEEMLWHKLVYGGKPPATSGTANDVWVRYREMKFGDYLDLMKAIRIRPSDFVVPACGTS